MKLIFKTSGTYAGCGCIAKDDQHFKTLLDVIGLGTFNVYDVENEEAAKYLCGQLEKEYDREKLYN